MDNATVPYHDGLLQENDLLLCCKVFSLKYMTPNEKGNKMKAGIIVSPESELIYLNCSYRVFFSGDVGYIDEDGFVFVSDRIKELIKYKGHQVLESKLLIGQWLDRKVPVLVNLHVYSRKKYSTFVSSVCSL